MANVSASMDSVPISNKQTHEILEAIKKRNVDKAIEYLNRVLEKKDFIPFMKYPSKGHKHGVPAGYPVKASKTVIRLLKELKSNAKTIGGSPDAVVISGYLLGRGAYPRFRGGNIYRHGKRTNLTVFGSVDVQIKKEGKKIEEHKEEEKKDVTQKTDGQ